MSARSQKTVGIVGAGVIASQVHLPILLAMDDVRVVWIADANERLARSVATDHGIPAASLSSGVAALPEAEVVLIAIPLPPRAPYLDHYARTDTALLVEKPLANDSDEHRRLVSLFPSWQLAVGYQRRYYASFGMVRSFVATGTLGSLRAIRVSEGGRTTRTDGAGQYQSLPVQAGGGILKNLGCHALDLAMWIADAQAFTILQSEVAWDGETDQRCRANVELATRSGRIVQLAFESSWIDRMENRIEFDFEAGRLSCPVAPAAEIGLLSPDGAPVASLTVLGRGQATSPRQAYYLEWRAMLEALEARVDQPAAARESLLCSELIDALLRRPETRR